MGIPGYIKELNFLNSNSDRSFEGCRFTVFFLLLRIDDLQPLFLLPLNS